MNPQKDPRLPIVALKGLPITIAALLCCYQQPVTQTHLCDLFDSSDKTMSKALHRLQEFQILSHSAEGWSITVHVTLLGLSLPEWLQTEVEPEVPVDKPVEKGRKFSDPVAPSSTSSSIKLTNLELEKNLLLVLDPEPETEQEPEFEPEPVPEPVPELERDQKPRSQEKIRECYETALAAGIWEKKARILAELPHVTPQFIVDHIKAVQAEGKEIQLAIYRIRENWEVRWPEGRGGQNQRSEGWEDRQRFVTGKHADWINH